MRPLPYIVAALIASASCRTPEPVPVAPLVDARAPDVPPRLAEANAELREYLRVTQLGSIVDEAQGHEHVLRSMIRWKTNRGRDATAKFEAALTRDAEPDVEEFALIRLAVYHLNLGCEVAALDPPAALEEARQGVFADMLSDTAYRVIEPATELLDAALALDGRRAALAQRLREQLPRNEAQVRSACSATREAWRSPDPASLDEVAGAACADAESSMCWVWATWGAGGDDALTRACEGDVAPACITIADRKVVLLKPQSNPSDAAEAEALYAKACGLGAVDGCRREVAVVVPAREDEYRAACLDEDDAVACLKLARTLSLGDPRDALWWSCTRAEGRPPRDELLAQCSAGDAFACATRAGSLQTPERYVISVETPASDAPTEAAVKCGEGDVTACAAGARAFARAGDWGCAAGLMSAGCTAGATDLCGFAHVD